MTFPPPQYPPAPGSPGGPPPPAPAYGYGPPPSSGHPVQVWVERASTQSRLLALFTIPFFLARLIILIPALVVLYFVGLALGVVTWIAQFGILFTGSYPEGMHRFVTGGLRWNTRASAYLYGLTDKYPPFSLQP